MLDQEVRSSVRQVVGEVVGMVEDEFVEPGNESLLTRFNDILFRGEVPVLRTMLYAAGIVKVNALFIADVNINAMTASDVSPANFRALSESEARELWAY